MSERLQFEKTFCECCQNPRLISAGYEECPACRRYLSGFRKQLAAANKRADKATAVERQRCAKLACPACNDECSDWNLIPEKHRAPFGWQHKSYRHGGLHPCQAGAMLGDGTESEQGEK